MCIWKGFEALSFLLKVKRCRVSQVVQFPLKTSWCWILRAEHYPEELTFLYCFSYGEPEQDIRSSEAIRLCSLRGFMKLWDLTSLFITGVHEAPRPCTFVYYGVHEAPRPYTFLHYRVHEALMNAPCNSKNFRIVVSHYSLVPPRCMTWRWCYSLTLEIQKDNVNERLFLMFIWEKCK